MEHCLTRFAGAGLAYAHPYTYPQAFGVTQDLYTTMASFHFSDVWCGMWEERETGGGGRERVVRNEGGTFVPVQHYYHIYWGNLLVQYRETTSFPSR